MSNKNAYTPEEAACFIFNILTDASDDAESNDSDASIRCFGIAKTNRK